jgi:hypothetical protein
MKNIDLIFVIIGLVVSLTMMLVKVDITIHKYEPRPLTDKRIKCDDHTFKKAHQNDRRPNHTRRGRSRHVCS